MLSANKKIKQELIKRWTELGLYSQSESGRVSISQIIADVMERSPEMKITTDRLSKYLSDYKVPGDKKSTGWLSDSQLNWLLKRYCIAVDTYIGKPLIENGKLKFKVMPYDEGEGLKNIKDFLKNRNE